MLLGTTPVISSEFFPEIVLENAQGNLQRIILGILQVMYTKSVTKFV